MLVATNDAAAAATALAIAGFGVAALYPVTLGDLMALPGVEAGRAASLATLASGTAILTAPAVLGLLAQSRGLRASFLIALPLLGALALVARPRGTRRS
jgi:MFS family permease